MYAEQYLEGCQRIVANAAAQKDQIAQAADWFAQSILGRRMVHLFGAGHSRILVEEMWPRYGSFPGFNPIVELSLTFHNAVAGAKDERQPVAHGVCHAHLRIRDAQSTEITGHHQLLIRHPAG